MCSRHAPAVGADAPVTYIVPMRSLESDHTFARLISVYGPKDLSHHLDELRVEFPDYRVGTPRVAA